MFNSPKLHQFIYSSLGYTHFQEDVHGYTQKLNCKGQGKISTSLTAVSSGNDTAELLASIGMRVWEWRIFGGYLGVCELEVLSSLPAPTLSTQTPSAPACLAKMTPKFVFAQLAGLQRSGKVLQLGPVVCSRMSDILQHDLLLPHIWYRHCTDLFWLRSSDFAWVWCQNCLAEEVPDCWIAFLGLHPAPL